MIDPVGIGLGYVLRKWDETLNPRTEHLSVPEFIRRVYEDAFVGGWTVNNLTSSDPVKAFGLKGGTGPFGQAGVEPSSTIRAVPVDPPAKPAPLKPFTYVKGGYSGSPFRGYKFRDFSSDATHWLVKAVIVGILAGFAACAAWSLTR